MQVIDHNPNEKRPTNTVWWILFIGIIFMWSGYLYARSPDWWSLALGAGTFWAFTSFVTEKSNNRFLGP